MSSAAYSAAAVPAPSVSAAPPIAREGARAAPRWALWAAFAVVYLVWGSTFLGIRVAVETLPPLTMAAMRFLIAGAVLLFVSRRGLAHVTARQWRNAAAIGTLFFLGNHGLVSSAARYIP